MVHSGTTLYLPAATGRPSSSCYGCESSFWTVLLTCLLFLSSSFSLCLAHSSCSDWVATSHFTGLIVNQASPLAFPGLLDWRQGPLLDCCHRHLSIPLSLIICTRAAGAVIICLPVYMCVLYLACGTMPAVWRHSGSSYSLHD